MIVINPDGDFKKMKKTFLKSAVTALLSIGLMAGSVSALPFVSTGFVDPNYGNTWNSSTNTGTALFEFYINDLFPTVNVTNLNLTFESDIFDLAAIDTSDFQVLSPSSGWNTSLFFVDDAYVFAMSGTSTNPLTTINDPLQITFNYTLDNSSMYYLASEGVPSGWAWDEGQAWGISYTLFGNDGSQFPWAISGGSTAPVPEPSTLLLLGIGLAGLVSYNRKRHTRNIR